jgi:hypothetical protein
MFVMLYPVYSRGKLIFFHPAQTGKSSRAVLPESTLHSCGNCAVYRTRLPSPHSFLPFSPMLSQAPVRTGGPSDLVKLPPLGPGKLESRADRFTDAIRASIIGSNNVPNEIKKDNLTCTAGDWILCRHFLRRHPF